jgi:hypothetical protein
LVEASDGEGFAAAPEQLAFVDEEAVARGAEAKLSLKHSKSLQRTPVGAQR